MLKSNPARGLTVAIAAIAAIAACTTQESHTAVNPQDGVEVSIVDVGQLSAMLKTNDCTAIDANDEQTRKQYGVIPGAVKLTSYNEYSSTELPADKNANLVFYCSSTLCRAAPAAAKKALAAGYTNVSHLKVGIKGWVEAGKKVDSI